MDKGKVIAFRVADTLRKDLLRMAETQGCTISDAARNIITEHVRVEDLLNALREIKKSHSQELAQVREEIRTLTAGLSAIKRESSSNGNIDEIRRIVTLIARAMPSVAKHVP